MKSILIRLVVSAVALWITSLLARALGLQLEIGSAVGAVVAVVALALVNAVIRPVLNLLVGPLNCLTFGLIGFVINALLFWLVGQLGIEGFRVGSFVAALFGSVVMGIISGLLNAFVRVER
ncbi:MAG: phage holin family protein [Armatimonadetes bacterium]|nr:phage holin family protein [Armatimonadota bacterium]